MKNRNDTHSERRGQGLPRRVRLAESLDDRIYFAVLAVAGLSVAAAFVMGLFQGLSFFSELSTFASGLWLAALSAVSILRPSARCVCRLILVCGLNLVLLPLAYFSSGAMTSGMPLFYLVGLFLTALLLRGRTRNIVFFVSLSVLLASFYFGWVHPEWIVPLTPEQQYQDISVTFFLTALTLGTMTVGIINAYDAERQRARELTERLTALSVRDPLTGLFNRRELFRRLDALFSGAGESEIPREQCHIAMFDVDNFKRLNDTYGHQFGDTVLSAVARELRETAASAEGEFAARYGGEEFVCVLRGGDAEKAFSRTDALSERIAALEWEDVPGLRVTVSGGFVSCERCADVKTAIHDVDQMLYEAKGAGKNRVSSRFRE